MGPPFETVGVGDGKADTVWHNSQTNETQIWVMDGHRISGRATVVDENGQPAFVGLPFEIVGVGDVTGDGRSDIVWHHSESGETQIRRMDGHRIRGRATMIAENGQPVFVGPPFHIVGVGDVG